MNTMENTFQEKYSKAIQHNVSCRQRVSHRIKELVKLFFVKEENLHSLRDVAHDSIARNKYDLTEKLLQKVITRLYNSFYVQKKKETSLNPKKDFYDIMVRVDAFRHGDLQRNDLAFLTDLDSQSFHDETQDHLQNLSYQALRFEERLKKLLEYIYLLEDGDAWKNGKQLKSLVGRLVTDLAKFYAPDGLQELEVDRALSEEEFARVIEIDNIVRTLLQFDDYYILYNRVKDLAWRRRLSMFPVMLAMEAAI